MGWLVRLAGLRCDSFIFSWNSILVGSVCSWA